MSIPNANADCVFPEDIMLCILTRLPVKPILRFRSVCKPWRELFSTPEFKILHQGQFSSDPQNHSFIVHSFNCNGTNTMSLLNIESSDKKPNILDHPFHHYLTRVDIVGFCNGLFCINIPSLSWVIVLWNPAMKLFKSFSPIKGCGFKEVVSLGFGYDAVGSDFKVVRIVCLDNRGEGESMGVNGVKVYSVNSESWITIDMCFHFSLFRKKNDVIVSGNPYWLAKVEGGDALVCFDVAKLVFKIVPGLTLDHEEEAEVKLVDWNGCLGALVCTLVNERVVKSLDVWVFDDDGVEEIWRKKHSFGPIELSVARFLQCSKNGKILGECTNGKLFVFDPKTLCVEVLFLSARRGQSFEICGYTESLAYVEGMTQVKGRNMVRKLRMF